jgi:hypothetical protein
MAAHIRLPPHSHLPVMLARAGPLPEPRPALVHLLGTLALARIGG